MKHGDIASQVTTRAKRGAESRPRPPDVQLRPGTARRGRPGGSMGAFESTSTALRVREPVQKRAKETHNRIIEAARTVFARHGFDAATTR